MAKSTDTLAAESRNDVGTTGARALRHHGRIPAIIFGHGRPSQAISLDARAFEELLHAGRRHHLLTVTVDGTNDTALIREIQRDPITRRIVHADFQRVSRSESITTTVSVTITGTAAGVREFGGVLDVVTHQVEVTGPADQIPEHIEVDVSALGIRDHFTAGDVVLPKGFAMATSAETIIASVEPPRAAEVEEAPAPAAGEVPTVAETETEPAS